MHGLAGHPGAYAQQAAYPGAYAQQAAYPGTLGAQCYPGALAGHPGQFAGHPGQFAGHPGSFARSNPVYGNQGFRSGPYGSMGGMMR